ncbi:MAG: phosphoribosyltransferase family protein [Alphaproteobacteria bacterium]|nr:phosphoribosyltransferase family protein [Alphaproteobacteria bacterium]
MIQIFDDRAAAGRLLGEALARKKLQEPVVLALPRGGVPVGLEVARALNAPLDLLLVRKIGAPFQPELAAAAVVDGDEPEVVVNPEVVSLAGVGQDYIDAEVKRELAEIERRRGRYLRGRARVPIKYRTAIVVDDGIATGASVRAAIKGLWRRGPKAVILAVPTAPVDTVAALRPEVAEIICLETPEPFFAIGGYYRDFHQLSDDEVVRLLAEADALSPEQGSFASDGSRDLGAG